MSTKSNVQRENLQSLAQMIAARPAPLGIGLRQECWAGVAITLANNSGSSAKDFYGLSLREMIDMIKENNCTPAGMRNEIMLGRTLEEAAA